MRKKTNTRSTTSPLAWEAPWKGLAFNHVPKWAFLYFLSAHRFSRRSVRSFLADRIPRGLPIVLEKRGKRRSSVTGMPRRRHLEPRFAVPDLDSRFRTSIRGSGPPFAVRVFRLFALLFDLSSAPLLSPLFLSFASDF
jgi:hypothetical protein